MSTSLGLSAIPGDEISLTDITDTVDRGDVFARLHAGTNHGQCLRVGAGQCIGGGGRCGGGPDGGYRRALDHRNGLAGLGVDDQHRRDDARQASPRIVTDDRDDLHRQRIHIAGLF